MRYCNAAICQNRWITMKFLQKWEHNFWFQIFGAKKINFVVKLSASWTATSYSCSDRQQSRFVYSGETQNQVSRRYYYYYDYNYYEVFTNLKDLRGLLPKNIFKVIGTVSNHRKNDKCKVGRGRSLCKNQSRRTSVVAAWGTTVSKYKYY